MIITPVTLLYLLQTEHSAKVTSCSYTTLHYTAKLSQLEVRPLGSPGLDLSIQRSNKALSLIALHVCPMPDSLVKSFVILSLSVMLNVSVC